MKKCIFLVGVAACILLAGCNNNSQTQKVSDSDSIAEATTIVEDESLITEDVALQNLTDIYTKAIKAYNDGSFMNFSYQKYESSRFVAMSKRLENEFSGGICIDYDYWINAQDWSDLKLSGVKISSFDKEERAAKANVDIINFGKKQRINIDLVFEKGQWLIDDFTDNGTSIYSTMQDCLKAAKMR